ncbi:MAG: general secretion pathway protein GspB [Nitrospirae bacterium]|nr:general secretion pathway protein GspB [Nitrospirota bacterium]
MSFILDQLKKSGKQRALEMAMRKQTAQQGTETDEPLAVHSAEHKSVSPTKWRFAAAAVLLAAVALFGVIVFFRVPLPMRQAVVPAAGGLAHKASPLPAKTSSVPVAQSPAAEVHKEATPDAINPAIRQKQAESLQAVTLETAMDKSRNAPEQFRAGRSSEEKEIRSLGAVTDAPPAADPAASVLEFKQLPHALRKSLPEIRITSHLYKKDSRLVSINGRIMSEGYNMDEGLFLEEIVPAGVIVSYGKYRFLVRTE